MYWLWHLSQEMPLWRYQYHQSSDKPRVSRYASILCQQLQAPSIAYSTPWTSFGPGRLEWYWKEHSAEDIEWKIEAELGQVRQSTRLARCDQILSRFRAAEFVAHSELFLLLILISLQTTLPRSSKMTSRQLSSLNMLTASRRQSRARTRLCEH